MTIPCPTCNSLKEENIINVNDKTITCYCNKQREMKRKYEKANIPQEYWYLDFDDFRKQDQKIIKNVKKYVESLDFYYKSGIGFFLHGDIGTGKTLLSICILKAAIRKNYQKIFFTSLSDIVNLYTAGWYNHQEQKKFQDVLINHDFIVIDDVGKEFKAGNDLTASTFDKVLRYRRNPTVITSNIRLKKIHTIYGESIKSLIYGKLLRARVEGADFRKELLSRLKLSNKNDFKYRPLK